MTNPRYSSDWTFSTAWLIVLGTLTAVIAVLVFPFAEYPAFLPAATAVFGAGVSAWVAKYRNMGRSVMAYRAGAWLSLSGWATYMNYAGYSLIGFLAVAVILMVLLMLVPMFAEVAEKNVTAAAESLPVLSGDRSLVTPVAMEWKRRIDSICLRISPSDPAAGVRISGQDDWDNNSGYTLTVEGPAGSGFTYRTMAAEIERLGAAARLKPGCILAVTDGPDHQGQALLHVPTRYELAQERTYPYPYSPLTVNRTVPIGYLPDGTEVMIEVREGSMVIVGRKGGGKTVLLHDITASFARCGDALVWHIDMNNGGMSAPWLLPWMEGKCEAPVISWFASNEAEAELMTTAALAILLHRKNVYARRAAKANQTNVPLDAEVPEIFIMIDEAAEVLGEDSTNYVIRENLQAIMRMGRAVGVNVLLSVLRPVGDHLPVALRKNCSVRVGMKVEESSEYDYLFHGTSKGLEANMIRNKGEGFIFRSDVDAAPVKFRSYNMRPDQIEEISIATQYMHPELDEKSLAARMPNGKLVSEVYADRWERAGDYLFNLVGEEAPAGAVSVVDQVQAEEEAPAASAAAGGDLDPNAMREWLDSLAEVAEPQMVQAPAPALVGEGAALVAQLVDGPTMAAEILARVQGAGRDVTRETVRLWLKEAVAAGLLEAGTKKGLYQPAGWSAPSEVQQD
jgi:hypothetical protein